MRWCMVALGLLVADHLVQPNLPAAEPQETFQVGEHVVVVRDKAEIKVGTKVIETVPRGYPLIVREVRGDWLAVTNGKAGWIQRRNVLSLPGAVAHFTAAIEKTPRDPREYVGRGIIESRMGRVDDAIADFTKAIRLNPQYSAAYGCRAIAWKRKGEYELALGDYNEAIRLDPSSALTWHNRGNVWLLMGNYAKAMSDFRESIRLDPEGFDGYNALAWLLATCPDTEVRDGKQAVEHARQACELCGYGHWHCLGTLAAAHAETGNFDAAAKWGRKALKLAPAKKRPGLEELVSKYEAGRPHRDDPTLAATP